MSLYFILLVLKQVNTVVVVTTSVIHVQECVKMFNLISRTNETKHIQWHETCKCKCRLDASICKNKQRWNNDKCRCEYEELIDKGVCDKGSVWNPSNCEWECDRSCDVGEYLDYENCKCRKKLFDKLTECNSAEECTENILFEHVNEYICCYTICVLLAIIALTISNRIGAYFAYSCWYLKVDITRVKFGTRTQWNCNQTTISQTYKWEKSNK